MAQQEQMVQAAKAAADTASMSVVVAAILQWIPEATAVLSFVWVLIRIYETETVQRWLNRRRKP